MKKTVLIIALIVAALVVAGVGVAYAQDETPPFGGHGPMMGNDQGPMHTFMVVEFARKLDLNVNDINTRLAAGETMYDIAISAGVKAEDFPAIMQEVRANALDAAVKANVITQEQADWMKSRGFGRGGRGYGNGDCTGLGYGQNSARGGHGPGMMGRGWLNQPATP